jgi:hypothetical protein
MRTVLDIDDALLVQGKGRAAEEGTTLGEVVEHALRAYLVGRSRHRLRWRTERGRLLPGVRLNDRDALFDFMDGRL